MAEHLKAGLRTLPQHHRSANVRGRALLREVPTVTNGKTNEPDYERGVAMTRRAFEFARMPVYAIKHLLHYSVFSMAARNVVYLWGSAVKQVKQLWNKSKLLGLDDT